MKYGSLYDKNGYMINNMAMILNKDGGLYKYGEKIGLIEDYEELIVSVKGQFAEFILIDLYRYKAALDIEEICILSNYIIMSSVNTIRLLEILSMSLINLKSEIQFLSKCGY